MKNFFFTLFSLVLFVSFPANAQKDLKLMTYNIRNANGLDNVRDFQRIANVINNSGADVVAVQELDSMTDRSEGKYVLGEIAERTQMQAFYAPAIDFDGGKYGIGILAKEKPLRLNAFSLPGREERRALLVAEFEDYVLGCTHLSLTQEDRMASLELIKDAAKGFQKPFFLAGDLNDEPDSDFIKALQKDFRILNSLKQCTYPASEPDVTIDYIAAYKQEREPFAVLSSKVFDEPVASDHRPVGLVLRMETDAAAFFRTKPYLQNPTDNGMTVMWETSLPAYSWVEYGTDTLNLKRVRLIIDGQAEFNESIHKIRLENLQPGQTYYYRVCSQEILLYKAYQKIYGQTAKSDFYSFTMPGSQADSFTAVVFNDLHQRSATFQALCKQVENIDYDLVVFNGDCVDDPANHNQATRFISELTEKVQGHRIPTIFIRGNHEIRNAYSIGLRKHVDYTKGKTYCAFNWGDTRFVILDCGEDKPDDHREYFGLNDFTSLRNEQVDFLKKELASKDFKKADKRVLIHHIPLYGYAHNLCNDQWKPLLDKAPFDVCLNAHTHRAAFHPKGEDGNNFPVFIGGGNRVEGATVIIIRKTKDKLNVQMLDAAGKVLAELDN